MSKKILAVATALAVAVLPVVTASSATAAGLKATAKIGNYCC